MARVPSDAAFRPAQDAPFRGVTAVRDGHLCVVGRVPKVYNR